MGTPSLRESSTESLRTPRWKYSVLNALRLAGGGPAPALGDHGACSSALRIRFGWRRVQLRIGRGSPRFDAIGGRLNTRFIGTIKNCERLNSSSHGRSERE